MKMQRLLLVSLILLSGCTQSYVMTLQNGTRLTTANKPKLKQGRYYYKEANGREVYIPQVRVRQIEPASIAHEEEKKNEFKASKGTTVKKKHWYWPF